MRSLQLAALMAQHSHAQAACCTLLFAHSCRTHHASFCRPCRYPDGRSTKVKVCGVPRRWVAGALGLAGALSVQRTHALLVLSAALLVGECCP